MNQLLPRQVHTITDRCSQVNTYLVNTEPLVIVDPASELHVRLLCEYLKRVLHRPLADIGLIVLTHLRDGHTGAVEALLRQCNAPVAASALLPRLVQARLVEWKGLAAFPPLVQHLLPRALPHLHLFEAAYVQRVRLVDIWLEDVAGLPLNPDWRVIASPGYRPDSLCLYNPFTAELLSGDMLTTVERAIPMFRSGTHRPLLEETWRTLRGLPVHYLYPGQGWPVVGLHSLKRAIIER